MAETVFITSMRVPQAVGALIAPPVAPDQVRTFLWQHIQFDLDAVHTAIVRSTDDVLVLMHLVLNEAFTGRAAGESR